MLFVCGSDHIAGDTDSLEDLLACETARLNPYVGEKEAT
jgi:hypothetical protein